MIDTQHTTRAERTPDTIDAAEAWAEEQGYPRPFARALLMADRLEHRLTDLARSPRLALTQPRGDLR